MNKTKFEKELIIQARKEVENHPILKKKYKDGIVTGRAVMNALKIING